MKTRLKAEKFINGLSVAALFLSLFFSITAIAHSDRKAVAFAYALVLAVINRPRFIIYSHDRKNRSH